MLKRFRARKAYAYKERAALTVPEGCRELTDEEASRINGGGKSVENSNEGVANAQPGDTVTRSDKTTVTLTQGDIDWAKEHVGTSGGASSTTKTPATTTPSTAQNGAGSPSSSSNSNATPTNAQDNRPTSIQFGSSVFNDKETWYEEQGANAKVGRNTGKQGTVAARNHLVQRELTSEGLVAQTIDGQNFVGRPIRGNSLTSTGRRNTKTDSVNNINTNDNAQDDSKDGSLSIGFGGKAALILGLGFEVGIYKDKSRNIYLYGSASIGCGIQTPATTKTDLSPTQYMKNTVGFSATKSFDPIQIGISSSTTADICVGVIGTYDLNNTNSSGLPNSWSFGSIGGGVWKTGTFVTPIYNSQR